MEAGPSLQHIRWSEMTASEDDRTQSHQLKAIREEIDHDLAARTLPQPAPHSPHLAL
jgi:hypothetical protein